LVAIGALAAPAAFHVIRGSSALAGNTYLQNILAGGIVGEALDKFNILTDVCAVIIIVAGLLLLRHAHDAPRARFCATASAAVTTVTLAITLYCQFSLFPTMIRLRTAGNMAAFDPLHHRYEALTNVQLPLLLVVALLSAIRDTPPRGHAE
jgi:hypothetical protein